MNQTNQGQFIELWPVIMLANRLGDYPSINPQLIALFREYQAARGAGRSGAFISPDDFANELENPAIETLKKFIMDNVYHVAHQLNQKYWAAHQLKSLKVNLTGLWFQISNDYIFHDTHVHGNCSWSGVYYVQSGNASQSARDTMANGMLNGVTRFIGPEMEYSAGGHGDWGNYYLHHNSHTNYPQDGMLLVFPSHIKHTAFPYNGEQDRIIVSFHAQVVSESEMRYRYSYG